MLKLDNSELYRSTTKTAMGVSDFLLETSIHGLKYLRVSRSSVLRSAWLACICSSFAAASVIIYLNVRNWENSPAVITTVDPTHLVKGEPLMPMVMLCPRNLDHVGVLTGLLEARPDLVPAADVVLLQSMVAEIVVTNRRDDRLAGATQDQLYEAGLTMFKACMPEGPAATPECDLAHLIFAIIKVFGVGQETVVARYLSLLAMTENELTVEGLQDYAQSQITRTGYDTDLEVRKSSRPGWKGFYELVMRVYALMFPVYADAGSAKPPYVPAATTDQYESPELPNVTADNFAGYLRHLLDRRVNRLVDQFHTEAPMAHLNKMAVNLYVELLREQLGLPADASRAAVADHLNGFAYDPDAVPTLLLTDRLALFPFTDEDDMPEMVPWPCGSDTADPAFDIRVRCTDAEIDETCRNYCETHVESDDNKRRAREVFELGRDLLGGGVAGDARPGCQMPGGRWVADCWDDVVSDRGVCHFTTMAGGTVEGTGSSDDHSVFLPVDSSGLLDDFNLNLLRKDYDLVVAPANHFAVGRYAEAAGSTENYSHTNGRKTDHMGKRLEVGVKYLTRGTAEFKGMSPERRHCFYPEEKLLRLFPAYSEPNCAMECAVYRAERLCGCVPWFLVGHFPKSRMCEMYGNRCFRQVLGSRYEDNEDGCDAACKPDCDKMEFEIHNFADSYGEGLGAVEETMRDKEERVPVDVRAGLDLLRINMTVKNIEVIKVSISKKSTLMCLKTATVTVVDMISNIGGTLGLFCGFSILSAVEIAYWMARMITKKQL